jgi:hypothetical protein
VSTRQTVIIAASVLLAGAFVAGGMVIANRSNRPSASACAEWNRTVVDQATIHGVFSGAQIAEIMRQSIENQGYVDVGDTRHPESIHRVHRPAGCPGTGPFVVYSP